jgi:hypothetical protein
MEFVELYMRACLENIETIRELDCGGYYPQRLSDDSFNEQMGRVQRAWRLLEAAIEQRRSDDSPQGKYGEAQLSARRALEIYHDPGLDEFPKLQGLVKKRSSHHIADYSENDLRFDHDHFYDVIQMLAHDQKKAAECPNPAARIRAAVNHKESRQQSLWRRRGGQSPEQPDDEDANGFFETHCGAWAAEGVNQGAHEIESALADSDFERALAEKAGLSPDQIRVLTAKINGLDLQSSKAPRFLGMTPAHLDSVRRSLEPNRKAGRALRRFAMSSRSTNPSNAASD